MTHPPAGGRSRGRPSLPVTAPPGEGWRIPIVRAFTERLPLKATALGLSVVLWFIITVKEPATDWVQATFRPVLDSSLVLRGEHPEFLVEVAGTSAEIARLRRRPPTIAPLITATAPDTLLLVLKATDVQVPAGIRVERIDPPSLKVWLQPRDSTARGDDAGRMGRGGAR
jgi:hypothetical protein